MAIKDMTPYLQEIGKIKIGQKETEKRKTKTGGEWQAPERIDHFLITGTEKDETGNWKVRTKLMEKIAKEVDQEPDKLTKIPIMLLFHDIDKNFETSRAYYENKKSWKCKCVDGENAIRKNDDGSTSSITCEPATCPYADNEKDVHCKWNGRLSVILPTANVTGGLFTFRTVGKNSISNIYASMAYLKNLSFGRLAGIPLYLTVRPKTVEIKRGSTTIYIVNIEYHGSILDLQRKALEVSKETMQLEAQYSHLLSAPPEPDTEETQRDIVEEYFPEVIDETFNSSDPKPAVPRGKQRGRSAIQPSTEEPEFVEAEPIEKGEPVGVAAAAQPEKPAETVKTPAGGNGKKPTPAADDKDLEDLF